MKKLSLTTLVLLSYLMSGCGGSGSDNSTPADDTNTKVDTVNTGVFVDAAVNGLEYSTLTQSGLTDSNGTFKYLDGEEVEFNIGGIKLGKVLAKKVITPLDLAGTNSPHNTRVQETLILLQSLDEDSDVLNGIKVSETIRGIANGMDEDFDSNVDLSAILVNLGIDNSKVVGSGDAIKHFKNTLNEQNKPTNPDEFSIINGVYQDDNTIMDINENGMITMYTYNTSSHCIDDVDSGDNGYDMDGLFVSHNSAENKYLVDVDGNQYGWAYSGDIINNVFGKGMNAATLNIRDADNKIFLTSKLSTKFTRSNLAENMCSVVGAQEEPAGDTQEEPAGDTSNEPVVNKFENIKGVYQAEGFTYDANATIEEQVRASVIYIDADAKIHSYKVDTANSCLAGVTSGDYNYNINSKVLQIRDFEYTINGDENLKQYYALDNAGNRFSWLETETGQMKYVAYKVGDGQPNPSLSTINVTDLKILLTISKSSTYTEANIFSNLCD